MAEAQFLPSSLADDPGDQGDHAKCLAAGWPGEMAEPFDSERLVQMLREWIRL